MGQISGGVGSDGGALQQDLTAVHARRGSGERGGDGQAVVEHGHDDIRAPYGFLRRLGDRGAVGGERSRLGLRTVPDADAESRPEQAPRHP
ncbi:hypothetical protein AQJ27_46390 [Streptomyces olivochromogenes]|nr:hypothetical protein AQJ27_46390 [Streptomyces olivochromogenes]